MRKIDWNRPIELNKNLAKNIGLVLLFPLRDIGGTIAREYSGKRIDGTIYGSPERTFDRFGGPALNFDGTNDYIGIQSYAVEAPMTLFGWINADGTTSAVANTMIEFGATSNYSYSGMDVYQGKARFYAFNGAAFFNEVASVTTVPAGWHFITATIAGDGTTNIYIDGILDNSGSIAFGNSRDMTSIGVLRNSDYQYGFYYNWCTRPLAHLGVCNKALTSNQVYLLYSEPYSLYLQPNTKKFFFSNAVASITNINKFYIEYLSKNTSISNLNQEYLLQASTAMSVENCIENTTTFESNTSWAIPAGVTSILVECWGAGAGGENGNSGLTVGGGGGGGGAYSAKTLSVTPSTSYDLTIGFGGLSESNGGDTYFGVSEVLAKGGQTGVDGVGGSKGDAEVGVGTTKYSGGVGGSAVGFSGGGGGSSAGPNSDGVNGSGATGGTAPTGGGNGGDGDTGSGATNGSFPGGGGGGGNASDTFGGNGANGKIVITYTTCTTEIISSKIPLEYLVNHQIYTNVNLESIGKFSLGQSISIESLLSILTDNQLSVEYLMTTQQSINNQLESLSTNNNYEICNVENLLSNTDNYPANIENLYNEQGISSIPSEILSSSQINLTTQIEYLLIYNSNNTVNIEYQTDNISISVIKNIPVEYLLQNNTDNQITIENLNSNISQLIVAAELLSSINDTSNINQEYLASINSDTNINIEYQRDGVVINAIGNLSLEYLLQITNPQNINAENISGQQTNLSTGLENLLAVARNQVVVAEYLLSFSPTQRINNEIIAINTQSLSVGEEWLGRTGVSSGTVLEYLINYNNNITLPIEYLGKNAVNGVVNYESLGQFGVNQQTALEYLLSFGVNNTLAIEIAQNTYVSVDFIIPLEFLGPDESGIKRFLTWVACNKQTIFIADKKTNTWSPLSRNRVWTAKDKSEGCGDC